MDYLTKEDLLYLYNNQNELLLSIYIPTFKRGTETLQNQIRFKNIIKQIKDKYNDDEFLYSELSEILKAAEVQMDNYEFWQHQSECLAMFLSRKFIKHYRLPLKAEESFYVGKYYYILPLISFLNTNTDFYILYLSQKEISLYSCESFNLKKINLKELSDVISEELNNRDFQKQLQFYTGSGAGGRKDSMFYGTGAKDLKINEYLLNFFNKIDKSIRKNLIDKRPLILAGADYIFPIYRQANSYPWIMEDVIHGNPRDMKKNGLMENSATIIKNHLKNEIDEEYIKLLEFKNTDKKRYSEDPGVIIKASQYGKIDQLFLLSGKKVWGKYNESDKDVEILNSPIPEADELLNIAAINTLSNGGSVYILNPENNKYDIPVAARLRY